MIVFRRSNPNSNAPRRLSFIAKTPTAGKAIGALFIFVSKASNKSAFTPTVGMNGADSNCPLPVKAAKGNSSKIQNLVSVGCRYLLGAVFLMAGVSKIVNLRGFESQVLLHSIFPQLLA